jgi:hypothetical protein
VAANGTHLLPSIKHDSVRGFRENGMAHFTVIYQDTGISEMSSKLFFSHCDDKRGEIQAPQIATEIRAVDFRS